VNSAAGQQIWHTDLVGGNGGESLFVGEYTTADVEKYLAAAIEVEPGWKCCAAAITAASTSPAPANGTTA
jgi:hypothetical protein